jgi:hypothetical protein
LALFAIVQLINLALSLAAAFSMANAYKITTDDVNYRKGAGDVVVTSYDQGADIKITCQAYGEDIHGNSIWDKTSDGYYVSDYYVKTDSDSMVTKDCGGGSSGYGGSSYKGEICRKEILFRGEYWVSRHVAYSMSAYYPDPDGRKYRTDFSSFVSMAVYVVVRFHFALFTNLLKKKGKIS